MTVPASFDSLIAKIIVTGVDREQALARSRRALRELVVEGMPTVVPFYKAVLDDPAFTAANGVFGVHTRWIETEFRAEIAPYSGPMALIPQQAERERVVVEVNGKRLEVVVPTGFGGVNGSASAGRGRKPVRRSGSASSAKAPSGNALTSPMQGTIVQVAVSEGQIVRAGDLVVVLEAMKMEQPLTAHRGGKITSLTAIAGATVTNGSVLCEIVDA
jgi:acetyl-CoA/propionyl-CoA carboxylase biotin carboxyl carrier protein